MAANTLDLEAILQPQQLAEEISLKWEVWKSNRSEWENLVGEVRDYVFATDTKTTTNGKLPFMNSTTIPKLPQIRMNLHSNYMSTLFSSDEWFSWQAHDNEASLRDKRTIIESYIRTKARQQNFERKVDTLLDDWILTGNCFCKIDYVVEKSGNDDNARTIFMGPKVTRISPHDIVFNLAANDFRSAPKIIRSLYSIGDLQNKLLEDIDNAEWVGEILRKVLSNRSEIRKVGKELATSDLEKQQALTADGFGTLLDYYNSDLVEVFEFYGDYWDDEDEEFYRNCKIVVVDRLIVAHKGPVKSLTGDHGIYHSAWSRRPDSLLGAGPLDNLVGMQYKIDKLENLRADVFEQIAYPVTVEVGEVRFQGVRGGPGGRYIVDEGGSVQFLRPDATALNADLQIAQTMQLMEEMAGAPRESMGIRSPGEKTRFEVQVLDNAANRIFRSKVLVFESFLEEVLNGMLEVGYRHLDGGDIIRSVDPALGIENFMTVTADDLSANGKLFPRGTKQSVQNANFIQNITTLAGSPIWEMIAPHTSRIGMAQATEEAMNIERFGLIRQNAGVEEDIETQRLAQAGTEQLQEESAITTEDGEPDAQQLPPTQ